MRADLDDDAVLADIAACAKAMGEQNVPIDGRWLIVDVELLLLKCGDKRQRRRIRRKIKLMEQRATI